MLCLFACSVSTKWAATVLTTRSKRLPERSSAPLPATPADVVAFEGDVLVVFPELGAVLRFGLVAEDA